MRCPSCRTPMAATLSPKTLATTHRCACGRSVTMRDAGMEPRAGVVLPGRLPVSPFKPLPEEAGWEQPENPYFDPPVPNRHQIAQLKRRAREVAEGLDRSVAARKGAAKHPSKLPETHPASIAWRAKIQASVLERAKDPEYQARHKTAVRLSNMRRAS